MCIQNVRRVLEACSLDRRTRSFAPNNTRDNSQHTQTDLQPLVAVTALLQTTKILRDEMQDIHYSNDSLDWNIKSVDTSVDELHLPQETEMQVDPPVKPVEDGETVLKVPRTTVEVVIEKKVELEPEDPILPDHYYDNGNIPVFKPVNTSPKLSLHAC